MAIHSFERRFSEADKPEVQERVREILTRDLDAQKVRRASEQDDRRGVDYWVIRKCGRPQGVDLKARRYDWGDVHVEMVSRVAEQKIGWTLNETYITDYVLYLFPTTYLLLPFPLLQATVRRNHDTYLDEYGSTTAKSKSASSNWETQGCAVPVGRLFRDMFGIGAPVGTPLTAPRTCPSCGNKHPVGTTCAGGWAPFEGGR